MRRILFILLPVFIICPVFSQDNGFFDGRLSAYTNISLSMFKYESKRYGERDIRPVYTTDAYDYSIFNIGPTDKNFFRDANISVAYDTEKFGGRIAVVRGGLGGFRAWVQFIPQIRLSVGDIDAKYADSLDADPGLRVYTGTEYSGWKNFAEPDNIKGDEGLMLEGFFGPVSVGIGVTNNEVIDTIFRTKPNSITDGTLIEERRWKYAFRIGSEIGRWGKVNASYHIEYENKPGNFQYNTVTGEIVPIHPDAEIYKHSFGLYASLTPLDNLGVTLGWSGYATSALSQFSSQTTADGMFDTLWPVVFINGLSLNARYIYADFTFRTDHNFSFWTDRDYRIMRLNTLHNGNILSTAHGGNYPGIDHNLLWNGLGVFYNINSQWNAGFYVRNLMRTDTSGDYRLVLNETAVEPRVTWKLNNNVEFFMALRYELLIETSSKTLNANRNIIIFLPGNDPVETRDRTQTFSVPLGFTMTL